MTQRKPSQAELDQLVTQARALTAQECQSWHPVKGVRCQLGAGHTEAHEWRAVKGHGRISGAMGERLTGNPRGDGGGQMTGICGAIEFYKTD